MVEVWKLMVFNGIQCLNLDPRLQRCSQNSVAGMAGFPSSLPPNSWYFSPWEPPLCEGRFHQNQQSIQQNMPWRFMIFNCLYQDVDHGVVFGISICIKCHEYEKRVLVTLYQYLVGTLCKNVASCKGSVPRFCSLLSGDLDLLID